MKSRPLIAPSAIATMLAMVAKDKPMARAQEKAIARRKRRNQKRLGDASNLFWSGGWLNYPPNGREQNLTSTRGQRRREKLGRT